MKIYSSWEDASVMLNANELAALLGISRSNAYVLMHSRGFPVLKIGARMLVPKSQLQKWIEMNTQNINT